MSTGVVPFAAAVEDVSRGNPKLPQSSFREFGRIPVVDQGQRAVAGYTNDEELRCRVPSPVIIFGDHTRVFKYVDFPFVIGADGVKVLRVREGWDAKYVFHFLSSRQIPSAGYSRHFKFLKELKLPQPSLGEQRRIAAILDHADALRAKRRQAIAHLDDLSQSVFHAMFGSIGDPRWERLPLGDVVGAIDSGKSPNCEGRTAGDEEVGILKLGAVTYGVFRAHENKAYLGEIGSMRSNEVRSGDVLMTRKNTRELVGAVALVDEVRPNLLLPDLIFRLALDESRIDRRYFQALMMNPGKRPAVRDLSSGSAASMPNISKARLRQLTLELPPIDLQREFAARVESINSQRATMERFRGAEDELFSSVQYRAFRGEL